MSGPAQFSESIVVRSVNYGESDRIIGLFSKDHGKISAFAGGARKSLKRFGAGLDLFATVRAELRPPRTVHGSLWRLAGVELIDMHYALRQDLRRFASASYLSECLWKMAAEGEAQEKLYGWWDRTLRELSDPATSFDGGFALDLELLALLGYAPRWDSCTECGLAPAVEKMFFSFERGGLTCPACRKSGEGRWLETSVVRAVHDPMRLSDAQRNSMRQTIDEFFTYTLGSEPRSLKFRNEVLCGSE